MRRHINWIRILEQLDNPEINEHFFMVARKLRKGKSMSFNRAAYNSLKNYYSTTTIDQLCEKLGI